MARRAKSNGSTLLIACLECKKASTPPEIAPYYIGGPKPHVWLHTGDCSQKWHERRRAAAR